MVVSKQGSQRRDRRRPSARRFPPPGLIRTAHRTALVATLAYVGVAALVIAGADLATSGLDGAPARLSELIARGALFIAVTGALLYLIVIRVARAVAERERRLNHALVLSYEHTLVGWSRALDLRDNETEGHSARVTELAVRLATAMGVCGESLEHIRRGAMLHDIGKIGIPDAILHKPGPLGDEEWAVMRRHPEFAYTMLAPIEFLHPVLDIPYCHHERWDGSGYPRGLAGEQIPLAARIFAVVDVWDALVSDRPYRAAWPCKQAAAYLCAHAGDLFDPVVVQAFLTLVEPDYLRRHQNLLQRHQGHRAA